MQTTTLNKRLAHLLGYGGLLPFLLLMLACWVVAPDWLGAFIKGQLAYGIAILSFLGGIHWSAVLLTQELSPEQSKRALVWSVTPALIAWFATMTGGFGFAVLMAGFFGAYQIDKRVYPWYRLPAWLIELRLRLTSVVIATLALTVIAANIRG
ncbi:DUF3429 domain-containing protein [Oxalobacteraceae bacterium OM1]|nr:DUF3429 domain-containing protein [Oxalobacteraceae bacterium OM1]